METAKRIEKILKISCVILVALIIAMIYLFISYSKPKEQESEILNDNTQETIETTYGEIEPLFTKVDWNNNHKLNNDYLGQIIFESEIINEPVVKGTTNDTYLRRDWITNNYSNIGTCFFDSRNELDDKNLIIYGHHADKGFKDYEGYEEGKRPMFSNLDLLLSKENYEDNSVLYLYLQKEVKVYKIAHIFYCPLSKNDSDEYVYVDEGFEYYNPNYLKEEFEKYHNTVVKNKIYDTGIDIDSDDSLLTLQTCVTGRADLREIVVAKLIDTLKY